LIIFITKYNKRNRFKFKVPAIKICIKIYVSAAKNNVKSGRTLQHRIELNGKGVGDVAGVASSEAAVVVVVDGAIPISSNICR
jgi:hypothetical protein